VRFLYHSVRLAESVQTGITEMAVLRQTVNMAGWRLQAVLGTIAIEGLWTCL